jgi:hypothetical protein
VKPWIDIHHLPSPEELESLETGSKPPNWLTKPSIPAPASKRESAIGPVLPLPDEGRFPGPPQAAIDEEDDMRWDFEEEMGDFQPREKPAADAGQVPGERAAGWFPRMVTTFGVLLLLILVGWLVYSVWNSRDRQTAISGAEPGADGGESWVGGAPGLAEKFANAATPEEWFDMVRDPERVAPLIRTFKPRFATGRPLAIQPGGSEPFGDRELYQFTVTYEDGRSRLIHILPTDDGPKVDWESFARSCGADISELKAPTPVEAELRVLVKRARYYNYNFADDRQWRAYELINGDWPETLTGYVSIGSGADDSLLRMVQSGANAPPTRVILQVRAGGEDGARGQCEILGVIQQGWVKP